MAKLEHLLAGGSLESTLKKRFGEVNENLSKSMKLLVEESDRQRNTAFSNSVANAVLAVTQNNQILLDGLSRMSRDAQKGITQTIDASGKVVRDESSTLKDKLELLSTQLAKLPKEFPIPKDVDLSGLSKDIKMVATSIKNIPTAEFPSIPKAVDLSPRFDSIDKKLSKRVHVFEIERDRLTELITKITVRVK